MAPVARAGGKYKVLHAFGRGNDGGGLYGGLVLDAKDGLYGTTSGGGAYGEGTVFKLKLSSNGRWTEAVLHSFCHQPHCTDGALPSVGLALDEAGNLYGSAGGGVQDSGVIFELFHVSDSLTNWNFQVLYDSGSDGLVLDKGGNLYGAWGPGKYGGGDTFELSPGSDGWTETYLYSFCPKFNCLDGVEPNSVLTWDANNNLYGTTRGGGRGKAGVAFELEHIASGWKEHVLHNYPAFSGDGYPPEGGLTLDQKGNVYGTTVQGGNFCGGTGCGTVFKLTRGTDGRWKETILHAFQAPKDGVGPVSGLVFDKAGNLYGTTTGGGDSNCYCGVVFKMTPGANGKWKYNVLHRFVGTDGFDPEATLIIDSKGNLYGTTVAGGAGGAGVVFEISP